MNKVVIKSLTEQKDFIAREKASMESLLEEYRTYDRQVSTSLSYLLQSYRVNEEVLPGGGVSIDISITN